MKEQNPQVSSTVSKELKSDINYYAEKEGRTTSNMVAILLQAAVNERNRKRKKQKDGLQPGKS